MKGGYISDIETACNSKLGGVCGRGGDVGQDESKELETKCKEEEHGDKKEKSRFTEPENEGSLWPALAAIGQKALTD